VAYIKSPITFPAEICVGYTMGFLISEICVYSSSEILQSANAFDACEWTVLSFEEAGSRTAACLSA